MYLAGFRIKAGLTVVAIAVLMSWGSPSDAATRPGASVHPGPAGVTTVADAASSVRSASTPAAHSTLRLRTVTVDGLRLRSKPSYRGYVKGQLYRGDRVHLRTTYDPSYIRDWVEVVLWKPSAGGLPRKTKGFVHKSYLAK
ncbi:SH3 domain-containing protein [Streptomyces sp. LX-29]|uniref:SH3 domain-containing protein n=1 Tax=Streptomyces sp. LX-29 TaxID=2900152 RepID=UPI00240CF3F5|nr:SH3 domain-containing protein [Streptomyces sp. LX-29]WFB09602.1 SH3 domain-containing protein [Streptomyces sp. LX-29]